MRAGQPKDESPSSTPRSPTGQHKLAGSCRRPVLIGRRRVSRAPLLLPEYLRAFSFSSPSFLLFSHFLPRATRSDVRLDKITGTLLSGALRSWSPPFLQLPCHTNVVLSRRPPWRTTLSTSSRARIGVSTNLRLNLT